MHQKGISFPNMWGKKVFFKENAWCRGNIVGFEKWTKSSAAVCNIQCLYGHETKSKWAYIGPWRLCALCVGECVRARVCRSVACVGVFIQLAVEWQHSPYLQGIYCAK